jgi:transcriptional regulator
MFLPERYRADQAETQELLSGILAADLVTATAEGPYATFLPLLYVPSDHGGSLRGHIARANDHHRLTPIGESLVIVHGLDAYITPGWYASKREHGRVVPTWNYLLAHVYGELVVHDDPDWVEAVVRSLTERQEAARREPWSVDDAPRQYITGTLRGAVGVELRITRVEAKAKLGLERSAADVGGVVDGLRESGDEALADLTEHHRPC